MFFEYSSSHLSYRCLGIASQRIYISYHVRFHEYVFSFDRSEQIAQPSSPSSIPLVIALLLNLLHLPLFHTHTTYQNHPSASTHPPLSTHSQ
jgi:hypothetical protein